jgi:hypothetical protein
MRSTSKKAIQKLFGEALGHEDMSSSSLSYIVDILWAANNKHANGDYGIYAHPQEDQQGNHLGYCFYLAHVKDPWHDFRLPDMRSEIPYFPIAKKV